MIRLTATLLLQISTRHAIWIRCGNRFIPIWGIAYTNRGHEGDLDRAIAFLDRAIEIEIEKRGRASSYNYFRLCLADGMKGENERAVEACTKSIQEDPQYDQPYYQRGLAFKKLGKRDSAIADFEKVLAISKNDTLKKAAEQELRGLKGG